MNYNHTIQEYNQYHNFIKRSITLHFIIKLYFLNKNPL